MDIMSMTGFGRAELANAEYRIYVELKSVNSRFLDLSVKIPKRFNALDQKIRTMIKGRVFRGKVDLFILYEDYSEKGKKIHLNTALAREYYEASGRLADLLSIPNDVGMSKLLELPDILLLSEEGEDDALLWERLTPCVSAALDNFSRTRQEEGEHLRRDILLKLTEMEEIIKRIEQRSPEIVAAYSQRIHEKVRELLEAAGNIDEARIVQEVTIFADKISTDEELVRLHSHVDSMRRKLETGGVVGRELDFLTQEMNREANTTLSKANDLIVADDAIGLKTLIEKIREQVQNIE